MTAPERFAPHDDDLGRRRLRRDPRENFATEATLANAGRARDRHDDRCGLFDAAIVGRDDLRKLGRATEKRCASGPLAALALVRGTHHRRSIPTHLELEAPASELAGGRVGEELREVGAVRETRRAV